MSRFSSGLEKSELQYRLESVENEVHGAEQVLAATKERPADTRLLMQCFEDSMKIGTRQDEFIVSSPSKARCQVAIRREVRRDIAHSRIQELGKQRDVVTAKLSELNQVKLPKELGMRELQALLVWAPTIVLFGVTMKLGKTTASFLDVSSLDVN